MTMLIGFAGIKRSGKDTAAAALPGWIKQSFAAPVRETVCSILGISFGELENSKELPVSWLDSITPRQMMQTLGTEWGRQLVHPDLWLRVMHRKLIKYPDRGHVITDVRFDNEAEFIRQHGGLVVQVVRDGLPTPDAHKSEQGIYKGLIDDYVFNNTTVEILHRQVIDIVRNRWG